MSSEREMHTLFQTKMAKIYALFQTKTSQKLCPLRLHIPIQPLKEIIPLGGVMQEL